MEVQMRKFLTAALAAATMGGAVLGAAAPADAQMRGGWHGGGYHGGYGYHGGGYYHGGGNWGLPLAAGIAGLAVGAALADNHPYYGGYGYSYGYPSYGYSYGYPAYGYSYAPNYCQGGRWVWDPYYHRNVWVTQTYAC
jgi:hypothetical protein